MTVLPKVGKNILDINIWSEASRLVEAIGKIEVNP